jgi:hypothetical protein
MNDSVKGEETSRPVVEHVAVPVTISWGAIFGGAVAALALWTMLYALGLALGLSALEPGRPGSLRSSGVFTGVWGLLAPLVALFLGGMIAGAAARVTSKTGGVVHGVVMWGLTTLVGAWGLAAVLSSAVYGVSSIGTAAVTGGVSALTQGFDAQGMGIDGNAALQPVNERLRAEGKPPISAQQLEAAARDSLERVAREGRFDREQLVQSIATATALSRQDAEQIAASVESQVNQARERLGQTAQSLQQQALEAADETAAAMWGVFGALLLGLLAAVAGATIGEVRSQRLWDDWFSHERLRARAIPASVPR